jgi:quinol monooxygenase YgiN
MTQVAQFAKFTARDGRGKDVVAALNNALVSARNEPGTRVYAIHQQVDQPDVVWMYELYHDIEAQKAHSGSAATAELRAAVADLLAEPLSVTRGHLGSQFGLPVS